MMFELVMMNCDSSMMVVVVGFFSGLVSSSSSISLCRLILVMSRMVSVGYGV